jgi:Transcriptional regulator
MTKDKTDRRIQKTRQLLKDALISLILEKGFESVTIQEILDRANVGRSTFYMHFENKYELLHSCFEEFNEMFEKHAPGVSANIGGGSFILTLFRLVGKNQRLCKALLGRDDMDMFFNPAHQFIFTYFDESIKKTVSNEKQSSLQLEMLAHYISSALIGTLRWWVYKDMPYTPEEMDQNFRRFALHDIKNFAGPEAIRLFKQEK